MKSFLRITLLLLALFGVGVLGYYAYSLTSQTLIFPFSGIDSQRGRTLSFVVAPPRFRSGKADQQVFDQDALKESLYIGTEKLSSINTVSGEYSFILNGGYVSVSQNVADFKKIQPITLKADEYNTKKTLPYRLPRDITLTPSDVPNDIRVVSVGEKKDGVYDVNMYGFPSSTPDDLRYYVQYDTGSLCDIRNAWNPDEGTIPSPVTEKFSLLPSFRWALQEIHPNVLHPATKDGQMWKSRIELPYNKNASRVCIITGLGGVFRTVEDRNLASFTVTGSTLVALSPEHDMKTQVEFRFSSPIYEDQGTLYSPEYIAHRSDAKIEFLKHLDISPHIDVKPEDLVFTPDRAIITVPFEEGKKYTLTLDTLSDVYGRTLTAHQDVTPISEPFLSLKLTGGQLIYKKNTPISAKIFSLKAKKTTYPLKLCRVSLEGYARLERMYTDQHGVTQDTYKTLLSGSDLSDCKKKDIVLSQNGYVSALSVSDFLSGKNPDAGLYVLAFADDGDVAGFSKVVQPVFFSVIDSHITLKVDSSGKMLILVTDPDTGKPLVDQEITVMRNISRTYTETWNPAFSQSVKNYLPLSTQAFATGIVLGRTDDRGMIETKINTLLGNNQYENSPYDLAFERWWDYEGRYDSFVVQAKSPSRFGYLVSTWNDGITGYNFGIKDSDYSYSSRPEHSAYLHTDRRLYLPGEKVYLHAILRKNDVTLSIPLDTVFDLVITDPNGREVRRVSLKTNEFGSLSTDFDIPKDASLGVYSVQITSNVRSEYLDNGWTNFQVQVFKNPTFTAAVTLTSPDLEDDTVRNLRKVENTDPQNPWYTNAYVGTFSLEGVIKAKYYNGTQIKNAPYTYRIYRSYFYDNDYWGDCFWGCYYEPLIEFYTEGTGSIDADGYGIFRVPVDYRSYSSDYKYTVEVTIKDPLSSEEVTTPGTIIVKLPESYKEFSLDNPLSFTPKKKILSASDKLTGEISPKYGKWSAHLSDKYAYEIIQRKYNEGFIDDIRAGSLRITTPVDRVIATGSLISRDFVYTGPALTPGEYHFRVFPKVGDISAPDSATSDTLFYVSGDFTSLKDNTLRVIPEKTLYRPGETAKVLIHVPFTGSHLLITKEKGGVIDKEYLYLTGNTLTKEIRIDDSVLPNAYIGVVALRSGTGTGISRSYAVGYGEIIGDIAEKKSLLNIAPDKTTYKNRDPVSIDLTLSDRSGNPLQGEVTLMVVDESLIRLLGNIDLDIIPKFYQKVLFTVKTSLSAIGIERNRFLSRKGSNGGSGDKGGGGVEIASRILFKNTAYYNPSIRTDSYGKAKVTFTLPDNITDYRIIALSQTRDSRFSVAEKTIEVRKDYVAEVHAPMILRKGDSFTVTVRVFNNTKRITPVDVVLSFGTGASRTTEERNLSLDVMEGKSVDFALKVKPEWKDRVGYTVELKEKGKVLDSLSQSIRIPDMPLIAQVTRDMYVFSGTVFSGSIAPSTRPNVDKETSLVQVSVSSALHIAEFPGVIQSLITYPYGCIEQTISSTLPNAFALNLSERIGAPLDTKKARENLTNGLKKILRMQHFSGGWTYWEGSDYPSASVTPYVIRSLFILRNLGETIPEESIQNGISYIVGNEAEYARDPSIYAEAAWTLALGKNERALEWWKRIDPNTLTRHGYLAYAFAAKELSHLTPQIERNLEKIMSPSQNKEKDYWYWSSLADDALYVRFLFATQKQEQAIRLLDTLVRTKDLQSYFLSTQEKINIFLALIDEANTVGKITNPLTVALRSGGIISDIVLSKTQPYGIISSTASKFGSSFTLKRDKKDPPLLITTRVTEYPKDLFQMSAYSTGGIVVERTFQKVDESRGVDTSGNYLSLEDVKSNTFTRGQLYRVTLRLMLPYDDYTTWYNLALEDFFPSGWRPIQSGFKTESALHTAERDGWWDYVETQDDRLLSHIQYGYGRKRSYSYYIRPEFVGEYTLPPARAYFMYRPEAHSYTRYEKIKVIAP